MAIAKKPGAATPAPDQSKTDPAQERAAAAFIAGKKKPLERERKTPTLIRLDDDVLERMDAVAARLGLSRAAYVRLVVSRALAEEERD